MRLSTHISLLIALALAGCAGAKPGTAREPRPTAGTEVERASVQNPESGADEEAEPIGPATAEAPAAAADPVEAEAAASDAAPEESLAAPVPEASELAAGRSAELSDRSSKKEKASSVERASSDSESRRRRPVSSRKPARPAPRIAQSAAVKAGEWDDNANYREFQAYLSKQRRAGVSVADVRQRRFIVVRDQEGRAMPNCRVSVTDAGQRQITLTTQASGRALLFPREEGLSGNQLTAATRCQGRTATVRFELSGGDGLVDLRLPTVRVLPRQRSVDIAFVLDTTGSMSEEISAVKATLSQALSRLDLPNVKLRVGLVEYKDRSDEFVTRVFQMTGDIPSLSRRVLSITARGGGDRPESVNEGLDVALHQLHFSANSVARLVFLIGDAPPHLDYQNDVSYVLSMKNAARRGIQMFTIAASGMDDIGQLVWRQLAQYTGGTNLFVLRGGAGPQSTGAGDPKSSCGSTHDNYTSGNLDALIVQKVEQQLAALDDNPLRIAGLMADEKAKPCPRRMVLAR